MYLTAHHVKSRDGAAGINAYLCRHSEGEQDAIDWSRPDIGRIADELPGRTVLQSVEVSPGGNAVLSYLDVAAPNGADPRFLADSLRLFEHYVRADRFPCVFASDRIALRFGITKGLQRLAPAEFRRLRARALQLVGVLEGGRLARPAPRASGPIRITLARDAAGETYRVAAESEFVLAAVRPGFRGDMSLRVTTETRADLEAFLGDVYPEVATALTGLSLSQLGQLGGAEVVEEGRRLWSLPAAGDIPGQLLGTWIRSDEPVPEAWAAPTGAILLRAGGRLDDDALLALDLVHVQGIWLPLSEAGVHTYAHATGLARGEAWSFVTRTVLDDSPIILDAAFTEERLTPGEVQVRYGLAAADRARPDHRTMQLQLARRRATGR